MWQRKRKSRTGADRMPEIVEIRAHYWQETQRVHGVRPLINFAREGALMKRLLEHGADVNTLKAHITRSIIKAKKGEARLALVNILTSLGAGMTGAPSQVRARVVSDVPFDEIITYLNKKSGCEFEHADPAIRGIIEARWSEGRRLEDFLKVIDNMAAKWGRDPKMSNFLRPSTIFSEKMGEYLGARITPVDLGLVSAVGYQSHLAGQEWLREEEERDRAEQMQGTGSMEEE